MIHFTADLHFNHTKVIGYSGRPFYDLADMNAGLIMAWQRVIEPHDEVYVLGDFAFSRKDGWPFEDIWAALPGKKHLVMGNHDEKNKRNLTLPWVSLEKLLTLRWEGRRFELCHYPMASWKNAHRGALMLHGHCHGSLKDVKAHRLDVGVDSVAKVFHRPEVGPHWAHYRPVSIEEVVTKLEAEPFDPVDHHA